MSAHRGITTLKDIFPEIRKEYKRNFLHENKIKIKNIQKDVKTRNQIEKQKQEETEKRKQKLQERFARSITRTTNSTSISNINSVTRSKSNNSRSTKIHKCVCGSKLRSPPISAKSTSSIDKEVQTDCDLEEIYRNNKSAGSPRELPLSIEINDPNEEDKDVLSNVNIEKNIVDPEKAVEREEFEIHSAYSHNRIMSGRDQRLESASNPFLYKEKVDYMKPHHEVPNSANWNDKFNQLKLDDEVSVISSAVAKNKSGRSVVSTTSTSRSDIKLPKYLEKEKREKEIQKLRELERDPDCPEGYTLLEERIRLENLEILEKGFKSLVDELNRLPMTSVTLRVKNRKNEIERDLADLENKIRFYQKSKIYIKCPTINT